MRTVGILGGMGPEATVLLMRRIIAAVPARDDADHVPLIVDQNSQVPSRIAHLIEGTGPDPAPVLAAMARRLEGAGAAALAMPCNTAHHYLAAIRGAVSVPVLDMVAASARAARAAAGQGGKVGLLASPAVAQVGLFDRALAAEGLEVVHPADGAALLAAIRAIKAEGPVPEARAVLLRASEGLVKTGAEVQLIACTEFSLIADAVAPGVRGIDTLDVLVREILEVSKGPA
jgi:aspartate racemase